MAGLRLIEEYFPGIGVCEDEDGIRILVVPERRFPSWIVDQAANHDAAAIVIGGTHFAMATDEDAIVTHFGGTEVEVVEDHLFPTPNPEPSFREMQLLAKAVREDRPHRDRPFVHLHAHSEFSPLDGLSTIDEMVAAVTADHQPALALTDHGICAGHPHLARSATKAGIKPIYGIEAYLVDDRIARPVSIPRDATEEERARLEAVNAGINDYYHLILWAETDEGLRNLWGMSTEANRDGFHGKPRMDWDTLARFSTGVIASTACLRGPICHALLKEEQYGYEVALMNIARLQEIFRDRLYVELHTNDLPDQIRMNQHLIQLAEQYSIPMLAAVDSHYPCAGDKHTHQMWLRVQMNKEAHDATTLFEGDADYHLMTAAEVESALSYLPVSVLDEAMANTIAVSERCQARMLGQAAPPVFSRQGGKEADLDRLLRICMGNWSKTLGKREPQEVYEARFEREMRLLIDKGFCGYFLMVHDQVDYAKRNGILVGPGRGSGSGSLVAYLMGITEIDPVETRLLFERFLTEGRAALPDFDVDYPSSVKDRMSQYAVDRWGEDRVIRVGTHLRLKNKGIVRDLTRVLEKDIDSPRLYADMTEVAKLIDAIEAPTAGLGMPWEEMWAEHGEALQPYRDRYPMLFALADRLVGRVKSYGRHAAGFVISTDESLTDRLPLWTAKGSGQLVVEFDMVALEELGLIKFDLLNLRNLDTIQMTIDLIREQLGTQIDVYSWKDEYDDPLVWDELGKGHTLGIFQIETAAGTKITREFKPQNMRELADVITLVRPGPTRSGLRKLYMDRRAGLASVTYPHPAMEEFLGDTWGCILYQEQVMQTCMALGGYSTTEADEVRKILGKKKTSLVADAGQTFIARCIANGHDQGMVTALWAQMAEFAKYSFNRAHAWGYAMLGYWTAWLKFHYPVQFMAALMSTEQKDNVAACVEEARRMEIEVLPPDINASGVGFKVVPAGVGFAVRYGLDQIKGVGEAAVRDIVAGQPYASWEDYLERKGRNAHSGVTKLLVRVGAFDSLVPDRRALEQKLDWQDSKESDYCALRNDNVVGPNGLPCTFAWENEPIEYGKSGKPLKGKPIPKRCSKACRQYVPRTAPEPGEPYTAADIRDLEVELLGTYLSSTPFDRIPESVLMETLTAEQCEAGLNGGEYLVAATVNRVKKIKDRNGRDMAFLTLYARNGELDVTVFSDQWVKYHKDFRLGDLALAVVNKNQRGYTLRHFHPC